MIYMKSLLMQFAQFNIVSYEFLFQKDLDDSIKMPFLFLVLFLIV